MPCFKFWRLLPVKDADELFLYEHFVAEFLDRSYIGQLRISIPAIEHMDASCMTN